MSFLPKTAASAAVLVLASKFDMTSDFITAELLDRGVSFARLNVEDLPTYSLTLDPVLCELHATSPAHSFSASAAELRGIYFRQPVFLRASMLQSLCVEEQIARQQWAAFLRSLMVFDHAHWINSPGATYVAEHKAKQLALAATVGFEVPRTTFTNSADSVREFGVRAEPVAVKAIDTLLARTDSQEFFGYTEFFSAKTLLETGLSTLPFILQEAVEPKLDLRVTVIGERWWAACITTPGGLQIAGDWRLRKGADLTYRRFELPDDIGDRCTAIVSKLGLTFGAIDLAVVDDRFIFFEVNPTGEWAWLADQLGFPIAAALCDALTRT